MLYTMLIAVHVVAALFLIGVVLLQTGKGADIGAVFGGGSSETVFGSSGAGTFLTRLTTGIAILFMLTSLSMTYGLARRTSQSLFDDAPPPAVPPAVPLGDETTIPLTESPDEAAVPSGDLDEEPVAAADSAPSEEMEQAAVPEPESPPADQPTN